jgi:hypothetical protein
MSQKPIIVLFLIVNDEWIYFSSLSVKSLTNIYAPLLHIYAMIGPVLGRILGSISVIVFPAIYNMDY